MNKQPTKREQTLARMRTAGYHHDVTDMTRILVESRGVSRQALHQAWSEGKQARLNGVQCSCSACA